MTWPTPWVPRDPDEIIAARRDALIADHRDDLAAGRAKREARRALYARLAEQTRARHAAALAALIEDLEWLLDPFAPRRPIDEIAARVGYPDHPESLARRLHRAGRHDLAHHFDTSPSRRPSASRAQDAQELAA